MPMARRALLDQVAEAGGPALNGVPSPKAREVPRSVIGLQGEPESVADVQNHSVPGPAGGDGAPVWVQKHFRSDRGLDSDVASIGIRTDVLFVPHRIRPTPGMATSAVHRTG